jgi:hypothetical protein
MLGFAAIATAFPATEVIAPRTLLAQRVVDGLPPPPALPPADVYSAPAGLPQPTILAPSPQQPEPGVAPSLPRVTRPEPRQRERDTRPRSSRQEQSSPDRQYVVIINGDSPLLLNQVRQVVPDAFVGEVEGDRVIQAGIFRSRPQASQQARKLSDQGIQAQIVDQEIQIAAAPERADTRSSVTRPDTTNPEGIQYRPSTQSPRVVAPREAEANPEGIQYRPFNQSQTSTAPAEVTFGQQPAFDSSPSRRAPEAEQRLAANRPTPYYIVIPSSARQLPDLREQVSQLGEGMAIAQAVEERDSRLGPHVLIGPFASRGAAERWNRYFRDFGMDARLYYRR